MPSSRIRQDLATWLPKMRPIAEGAGAAAPTDWALELLAVFDDQSTRFAVVRATPSAGGNAKVTRVVEGAELYGFKVASIEPLRVRLTGDGGEKELRLFKPEASRVSGTGKSPVAGVGRAPDAAPAGAAKAVPAAPQASQGAGSPGGAKAVATQELKPGQAFELPESMKGLKVVDAPVPPAKSGTSPGQAPSGPPPPPQKP
jgi:hypothetical protein